MQGVDFRLKILGTTEDPPTGFLFLCPETDFQTGPCSFSWPDLPAYWSFCPSGGPRLSLEEAKQLGFPSVELCTVITASSWDADFYAGLRCFHQAQGFDPDSLDVAWYLGCPLLELSSEYDAPFAHGKLALLERNFLLN